MFQPQNLVLTGEFPDCDVKLCDFGISRYISHGADIREILGTPDYVGKYFTLCATSANAVSFDLSNGLRIRRISETRPSWKDTRISLPGVCARTVIVLNTCAFR